MARKGDVFKSGDTVPVSGIYYVIHDKLDGDEHAHSHPVIAKRGSQFPECARCHDFVQFRLHQLEEHIEDNEHFRPRKNAPQLL
jgi:hypothetical protein